MLPLALRVVKGLPLFLPTSLLALVKPLCMLSRLAVMPLGLVEEEGKAGREGKEEAMEQTEGGLAVEAGGDGAGDLAALEAEEQQLDNLQSPTPADRSFTAESPIEANQYGRPAPLSVPTAENLPYSSASAVSTGEVDWVEGAEGDEGVEEGVLSGNIIESRLDDEGGEEEEGTAQTPLPHGDDVALTPSNSTRGSGLKESTGVSSMQSEAEESTEVTGDGLASDVRTNEEGDASGYEAVEGTVEEETNEDFVAAGSEGKEESD